MKKELATRRKKGVRRLLIGITAMVLVDHFMLIGLLLPIQAIAKLEERQGIRGFTTVVARDWAPEIYRTHLVYLTANDNAKMLGDTYLTLFGWSPGFGTPLDCAVDEAVHVGMRSMSRNGGSIHYYFGRVDDTDIETVVISGQTVSSSADGSTREEAFRLSVRREDFLTCQGQSFFLIRTDREGGHAGDTITGYDRNGGVVYQGPISQGESSVYGL